MDSLHFAVPTFLELNNMHRYRRHKAVKQWECALRKRRAYSWHSSLERRRRWNYTEWKLGWANVSRRSASVGSIGAVTVSQHRPEIPSVPWRTTHRHPPSGKLMSNLEAMSRLNSCRNDKDTSQFPGSLTLADLTIMLFLVTATTERDKKN